MSKLETILPTLFSLFIIFFLLPITTPSLHSSIFTSHIPRAHYHKPRNYASYPFARVCSPQARNHFLSRHTRAPKPILPEQNLTNPYNRVFLSSIPHQVGDGLGHRTCILNYELTLARLLGLTYTHRNSTYGSLTRDDPGAVERFFHWGNGSISRDSILQNGCADVQYTNDTCEIPSTRISCGRVKPRSRGGSFDQSVIIPESIAECLLVPEDPIPGCVSLIRPFLSAYPEPNTLFQLGVHKCFHEYLYTNFSATNEFLKRRYWGFGSEVTWDVRRVQIALHVRRGDFFNYTNRVLVSDSTFADVVWRVKHAMDEMVAADVPVDVHVYSEGRARGRVKDVHDTALMDGVYIDEKGVMRDENHWNDVIRRHRRARKGDVQVFTHFAEDTLKGVGEMIGADVFVGSVSGLSIQVVRVLGRGVLVLPIWEGEVGDEEDSVVAFDWNRNGFDSFVEEELLYETIAKSVRRHRLACAVW